MKVLIQDRKSRLYWNDGDWVRNPAEAHNFKTSAVAIDCAMANRLKNVQVVLKFPTPEYDVTLRLPSGARKRQPRL